MTRPDSSTDSEYLPTITNLRRRLADLRALQAFAEGDRAGDSLIPGDFFEDLEALGDLRRVDTRVQNTGEWLEQLQNDQVSEMGREDEGAHGANSTAFPNSTFRGMNQPRLGFHGVSLRKIMLAVYALFVILLIGTAMFVPWAASSGRPSLPTGLTSYNATAVPDVAFQPPEVVHYRAPDSVDTFHDYKYREVCDVASTDLHAPFAPLCGDRQSMLTAMSSGGRIGQDAPYMPRGCDMRWFTTEEICEILSRFQKVIFVGDSMMRHVIGSLYVLMRKDLGYGAVTDWNFSPQERKDCFCNRQFNVKTCSVQGIFKTADVIKHDPGSLACEAGAVDVMIELIVKFPIPKEEIDGFKAAIGTTKPAKPYAFIFGHGLWNDLDLQATVNWLDELLDVTRSQLPYLSEPNAFWPRLFITPNAAGPAKPDEWILTQGNKPLMMFEESVNIEAGRRGVEHLGTWNMSIQATKYDGVHVDLKGNLVKAMMVLNWLNMLEVDKHNE